MSNERCVKGRKRSAWVVFPALALFMGVLWERTQVDVWICLCSQHRKLFSVRAVSCFQRSATCKNFVNRLLSQSCYCPCCPYAILNSTCFPTVKLGTVRKCIFLEEDAAVAIVSRRWSTVERLRCRWVEASNAKSISQGPGWNSNGGAIHFPIEKCEKFYRTCGTTRSRSLGFL